MKDLFRNQGLVGFCYAAGRANETEVDRSVQ
jgi:hypothetical protein